MRLEIVRDDGIDVRPSELLDQAVSVVEVGPWIVGLIDDRLILKRDDDKDVLVLGD